ncbi:MAG: DUF1028 domain-containing protein [Bacteroidota bacterium]
MTISHQRKWGLVTSLLFLSYGYSQNVPSLLNDSNINATFSIVAFDQQAQEWGIAVATNNIYVGNSTIYITPGVGAFSVIAETAPKYGHAGLANLKEGKSITEAIEAVKAEDEDAHYRQVAGIDAQGEVAAFTGKALSYWPGYASHFLGQGYVVLGNQLAEEVLSNMAKTFENTAGTLAERLMSSLVAGQQAGGQISGKQSAALVVKGSENEWFNQIDLRVDHSKTPIADLQRLLNYHYGRIRLNQAYYAYEAGNTKRATNKLAEAEALLQGWTGMYAKIAQVHLQMSNEAAAVTWIKKGLTENKQWIVYLPAFYVLRHHPEIKTLIKSDTYNVKDWESAISMLGNLGQHQEAIDLGNTILQRQQSSSYLHFLLAKSHVALGAPATAIKHLQKALKIDAANREAELLLNSISATSQE